MNDISAGPWMWYTATSSRVDTSGTRIFLEATLHRQDLSDCSKTANFPLWVPLCLNYP